ncbi:hypothetical protein DYH09_14145 [bacterium CPR1]|nr:hypothetical protein [bacterium CPR1]
MWRRIFKASLLVALGVAVGRLSGFIRELVLIDLLGLSRHTDIAVILLSIPDMLTNFLVGGALGAALVPLFQSYRVSGREVEALAVFWQATLSVLFFSLVPACLVSLAPLATAQALAPGFDREALQSTTGPIRLICWLFPLSALAAVSTAWLQARGRFAVAALGTLIMNATLIAVLLLSRGALTALAAGALLGGGLRFLSQLGQLVVLERIALLRALRFPWVLPGAVFRSYGKAVMGQGFLFLIPVAGRLLASQLAVGDVAAYNYASKMVEVPLGGVITVLSVVLFPSLTELFSRRDIQGAHRLLRQGILITWLLAMASGVTLVMFGPGLTQLLLRRTLDPVEIQRISWLVGLAMVSVPARGLTSLLVVSMQSRADYGTPLRLGLFSLLMFAGTGWLVSQAAGLTGLILTTVVLDWLVTLIALWLVRREGVDGSLLVDMGKSAGIILLIVVPPGLAASGSDPVSAAILAVVCGLVSLGGAALPAYRTMPSLVRQLRRGLRGQDAGADAES